MKKNSLVAIGNFNNHITQVNIDGLTKEKVEQLCLKLINGNCSVNPVIAQ